VNLGSGRNMDGAGQRGQLVDSGCHAKNAESVTMAAMLSVMKVAHLAGNLNVIEM
jgi:hypothetical protein